MIMQLYEFYSKIGGVEGTFFRVSRFAVGSKDWQYSTVNTFEIIFLKNKNGILN